MSAGLKQQYEARIQERVPLTERRAGYAIRTPGRCSKKEISKALWFSARNGSEVLGDLTVATFGD